MFCWAELQQSGTRSPECCRRFATQLGPKNLDFDTYRNLGSERTAAAQQRIGSTRRYHVAKNLCPKPGQMTAFCVPGLTRFVSEPTISPYSMGPSLTTFMSATMLVWDIIVVNLDIKVVKLGHNTCQPVRSSRTCFSTGVVQEGSCERARIILTSWESQSDVERFDVCY